MSWKMILSFVACLAIPAGAQESIRSPKSLPSTATLPATYPIITISKPCSQTKAAGAKKAGPCQTVITRTEFEALVHAINPRMPKAEQQELAERYGTALALSQEAIRRGMDHEKDVKALIHYQQISVLANAMTKDIYRENTTSDPEAVEAYYNSHKDKFERFSFERIYIPAEKQAVAQPADSGNGEPDTRPEMKALADKIYARAKAGEDFDKLQREAFKAADITTEPTAKIDNLRSGDLSTVQNVIFDMKPGEMSPLLTDASGYFIYKLVSRVVPPYKEVHDAVDLQLQQETHTKSMKDLEALAKTQVNKKYFDDYDPPAPNPNEPEVETD
ncbi:MAG: peptidyl-prolyl cis-trans isomerase [Acidobacteriales bacterium]|nr:peptidyl-prolyl cis-trans isomerase [Terriglobales bacterium]